MATNSNMETSMQVSGDKLDLANLVREATWKDVLMELVKKEKLDPWNIDIVEIIDKYVSAVKGLKILDLHIPANIILAASILLRFKSEVLLYTEQEEDYHSGSQRQEVLVEPLTFRLRIPPKRRVTLPELISALDEAMTLKEARGQSKKVLDVQFPLVFNSHTIQEDIERIYGEIKANVDKSRMVTFSAMVGISNTEDVLTGLFIPLLFLAQKDKVTLVQERFFDEIIIALN